MNELPDFGTPPFAVVFDDKLRNREIESDENQPITPLAETLRLLHDVLRQPPSVVDMASPRNRDDLDDATSLAKRILGLPSRFVVRRQLGRGSFGIVFLATDQLLQRDVAIKIPHIQAGQSEELHSRFLRESRAASRLNHPSIVRVLDSGETMGVLFQVSEFVNGERLKDLLVRGDVISQFVAADFTRQLADAVQHAHERKVLHRDIKPENILLDVIHSEPFDSDSQRHLETTNLIPRLTDFGLARLVDDDAAYSRSGLLVGTPKYMSPEQLRGQTSAHSASSDIYSLGVVLYEMLTGTVPFPTATSLYSRIAVSDDVVLSPSKLRTDLSKDLTTICLKCLEVRQERRYLSAGDLRDDLIRYLDGRPTLARPQSAVERLIVWAGRHQILALTISLSLALAITIVGLIWRNGVVSHQQNKKLVEALHEAQRQQTFAGELKNAADQSRTEAVLGQEKFRELSWKSGIREAYVTWEKRRFAETSTLLQHLLDLDPSAPKRPEWTLLQQELNAHFREIYRSEAAVHELRVIPGTNRIVLSGGSNKVVIVDTLTETVEQTIVTNIPQIHSLAVSADGSKLAVGGTAPDGKLSYPQLFDLPTGKLQQTLAGQPATVESLMFDQNASRLIVASRYEPVVIIELSTGKSREIPATRRNQWIDMTDDGKWLVTQASKDSVYVTELNAPEQFRSISTSTDFQLAAILPGTNLLAVALSRQPKVELIDLSSGRVVGNLKCASSDFSAIATSLDGGAIYLGFEDGTVTSFEIPAALAKQSRKNGSESPLPVQADLTTIIEQEPSMHCGVANDRVMTIQCRNRSVLFAARDGLTGELVGGRTDSLRKDVDNHWISTSLDYDGRSILAASTHKTVYELTTGTSNSAATTLINSQGPTATPHLNNQSDDQSICHNRGRRQSLFPLTIEVYPERKLPAKRPVKMIRFSKDGRRMAIGDVDGNLGLYDRETDVFHWGYATSDQTDRKPINSIAFSDDAEWVAWVGTDGMLCFNRTDSDTPGEQQKLPGNGSAVAIAPNQLEIAVGGRFEDIRVFDTTKSTFLRSIPRVPDCTAIIYSKDGKSIFSGHRDGTIRYGSLDHRKDNIVRGHSSAVMSIALLDEFDIGISIDEDSNIALWYLSDGMLIGQLFLAEGRRRETSRSSPQLVLDRGTKATILRTIIEGPQPYIIEYRVPALDVR